MNDEITTMGLCIRVCKEYNTPTNNKQYYRQNEEKYGFCFGKFRTNRRPVTNGNKYYYECNISYIF